MQILFLMRYSYFGESGWRSEASRDLDRLLDPQRLKTRAEYLSKIALPSLAAQNDGDFRLVVLSSEAMPDWRRRHLTEMCKDTLGTARATVVYRRPGHAAHMFRRVIQKKFGDAPATTQVVLDDDDAVSRDFVERLRPEAQMAHDMRDARKPFTFLSFPRGLTLSLADRTPRLYHRMMPFTNLGLSLVGPTDMRKNVFGTAHKQVARHNPARVIYGLDPTHIRTVHDHNDSRAMHGDTLVPASDMARMLTIFPCLAAYFPQAVTDAEKPAVETAPELAPATT